MLLLLPMMMIVEKIVIAAILVVQPLLLADAGGLLLVVLQDAILGNVDKGIVVLVFLLFYSRRLLLFCSVLRSVLPAVVLQVCLVLLLGVLPGNLLIR